MDFRSGLFQAFPGGITDELAVFIAVAIKELGGEEPEGSQPAPPGTDEYDHEGCKFGRGISGAVKNIPLWAESMQKVS